MTFQKSTIVLRMTLERHRDISVGYLRDKILDTPDPYFKIKFKSSKTEKLYRTLSKINQPTADLNETFSFVLNEDEKQVAVEISVYDEDVFVDDNIGTVNLDFGDFRNEDTRLMTLKFAEDHGELDIKIEKYLRHDVDFRVSSDVSAEEKMFVCKRKPKVHAAIQRLLKRNIDLTNTPVCSVVGSGGGYRAMTGMSGGMAALKDAGIMDALTYAAGLSGSSWYLCSAFAHNGLNPEKQKDFHELLRERMKNNAYGLLMDPLLNKEYIDKYQRIKQAYGQPTTFVDYFGFVIGESLLGKKRHLKLSELRTNLEDGNSLYPIFTSVHAKEEVSTSDFYVYAETTPHEISFPRFGINIVPEKFGSHWDRGLVTRMCPEFPLHYYLGSCGCAFSVLLKTVLDFGTEENPTFVHVVGGIRHHLPVSPAIDLATSKRRVTKNGITRQSTLEDDAESLLPQGFLNELRNSPFFRNRRYLIDRTANVLNFAYNYDDVNLLYPLSQESAADQSEFQREVLKTMGMRNSQLISKDEELLSICDAGIVKNVSVDCVIRPSRSSDLIIVMDMNHYKSDTSFDYMPILQSAEHAWRDGLPFPPINVHELVNSPPKEFLVFESNSDNCPTVLWFTLCNKRFMELTDFKPKQSLNGFNHEGDFNNFPVFSDGSAYSTYKFNVSNHEFDQLHELMYYNVSNHVTEIKEQIAKAVDRRQRREANANQLKP